MFNIIKMKTYSLLLIIILFLLPTKVANSQAQENWLPGDEFVAIQKQSRNAVESYSDLLNDIIADTQSGSIGFYFTTGDPLRIFQDESVPVCNEINPKTKTFLTTDIKSYLNYWFTYVNGKEKNGDEKIVVSFKNIYVSPVFLDQRVAFTKVYFQKSITYKNTTEVLNEYAIIRSTLEAGGWLSLISGIDLLEDKVKIDENSITKELLSARSDLGVLTEIIKPDSTIITYQNFNKYITPTYSRTIFANKYTSIYYYDQNLYQCVVKDYKVSLKKDSISVISPGIETYFNTSGFNIHNTQTGFQSRLTGEKNLEVDFSGCFAFRMNNETATIKTNHQTVVKSSPDSDQIDFTDASKSLMSLYYSNSNLEVKYDSYQMNFHLTAGKIILNYKNYLKKKTIYASNTKLSNMELISVSGDLKINDFYIDKNEVTIADFKTFVEETGYITEIEKRGWSYIVDGNFKPGRKYKPSGDEGLSTSLGLEKGYSVSWKCDEFGKLVNMQSQDTNRPVIHVNYYDALHYCNWAGKQLPSRDEMLYAANEIINGENFVNYVMFANTSGGKINRVRQKLETNSHIWDVLGNVYEWCSDSVCEQEQKTKCLQKHVFGGYWNSQPEELKINYEKEVASYGSSLIGFRGVIRKIESD
jgi:hypothetical protein